jgi:hypothetical protein
MRSGARVACAAWTLWIAPLAAAQQGAPDDGSDTRGAARAPSLDLDKLLNPKPGEPRAETPSRPGGKDRETWQREFQEATAEVGQLRSRVEESQRKMREAAGETGYSYSPAGGGETYDPDVLKTRAQLQRDRQSLQAAERRLRDLKVEASLAGVPPEWQGGVAEPGPVGD